MNSLINNIKLESIKNLSCEGYFWLSDATSPQIIEDELLENYQEVFEQKLPFVIEAYFYHKNEEKEISIGYKNIDGQPFFWQVDLSQIDSKHKVNHDYLGISFKDKNETKSRTLDFQMCEVWEEVNDVHGLLAGMPTLKPGISVFAGFKK